MKQIVRQKIFDVTALFYEDITAFMELTEKVNGKCYQKVDRKPL